MQRTRINIARLSPTRRAFLFGYRRARVKARAELRAMAADFDAELSNVQQELAAIWDAYHEYLLMDAAVVERRQLPPDTLLH